jgi:hypothetical protein
VYLLLALACRCSNELGGAAEVERHARLIADHPGVVTGPDHERVTGPQLHLGAVGHPHPLAPGDDIAGVGDLAQLGAGERLDVLRPAPAGLEHRAPDRRVIECDQIDPALLGRGPALVRAVEALDDHARHHCAPAPLSALLYLELLTGHRALSVAASLTK